MKIIDAHIHLHNDPYFDRIALAAGHENTLEHLKKTFERYNIAHAIVMGNNVLGSDELSYPDYVSYCVGLDSIWCHAADKSYLQIEKHLQRPNCVGIKLYPGYISCYVSDPIYQPIYELAKQYKKPVAIHTGATAASNALLKYSHPLTVDEVAVQWPDVNFIMCHIGNPWFVDAAAVMDKNPNVAADLSGLLEGLVHMPDFLARNRLYLEQLKTWLSYLDDYERLMYGTDWPLANIGNYIDIIKEIIPERHWEKVFFHNANRIYKLNIR